MKKLIKQDGKKKVFIYDDGSEVPFNNNTSITLPELEEPKKKKFFKKESKENLDTKD